jgi:hypothetical protein
MKDRAKIGDIVTDGNITIVITNNVYQLGLFGFSHACIHKGVRMSKKMVPYKSGKIGYINHKNAIIIPREEQKK